MTESQTILDLSSLPEQARTQLFDFYEFLSKKYNLVSPEEVPGTYDHRTDFTDLFGVWSENDVREFCRSVEEFDKIDPEDWH
ncbi:hypothetical protein QUF80_14915 [Desulfococcaceae bacterium HSG8]|nr:hypothetical protein [Desulfococcaceae bacterium HSG8]